MKVHDRGPCSIAGCRSRAWARGWCRKHYMRWHTHGTPEIALKTMPERGAVAAFLRRAMEEDGDECLFWPFARNNRGYAQIKAPRDALVNRVVCEARHGPPPLSTSVAAHSCGNGHLGCVRRNHLRWATAKENSADMIAHGRSCRGRSMATNPLTETQVREIYRRVHAGEVQSTLAAEFGIAQTAVSKIKRQKTWAWLTTTDMSDMLGVRPNELEKASA